MILVMYTAIFTPYVAAFLLNEPDYTKKSRTKYADDPIVIIDLIGKRAVICLPFQKNKTTQKNKRSNVFFGKQRALVSLNRFLRDY